MSVSPVNRASLNAQREIAGVPAMRDHAVRSINNELVGKASGGAIGEASFLFKDKLELASAASFGAAKSFHNAGYEVTLFGQVNNQVVQLPYKQAIAAPRTEGFRAEGLTVREPLDGIQ